MPAWKNYLAGIVLGKRYYFLEIIRTTSFSIGQVYFSTIGHLPKLKYCVFFVGMKRSLFWGNIISLSMSPSATPFSSKKATKEATMKGFNVLFVRTI